MTRLLMGELTRLLARRLVRILALLAVAAIAVAGVLVFLNTRSIDEQTYQREAVARVEQCLRGEGHFADLKVPPSERDQLCRHGISAPRDVRFHLDRLGNVLKGTTAPLAIVAWLIGASAIGADWQSRTVTTILTWEPRRVRVLAAKVMASVAVAFAFTVAVQLMLSAALVPSALFHGTTAGTGGTFVRSVAAVVLRGSVLASVTAAIGFSIASVGRNTSAALGAGFAYVLVVENVLANVLPKWRRWLLLGNAIVFVSGHNGGGEVAGRTVVGAGVFLVAVALTLFFGAATAFRRRDVA